MGSWASLVPTISDDILRREGLHEHSSLPQCASCMDETGAYRCIDCTSQTLFCASCVVFRHDSTPLHRLEVRHASSDNPFRSSSCLVSSGMEGSLNAHPSMTWVTATILVTNTLPARHRVLKLKPSSSSTSTELTKSMCNFARAWGARSGSKTTGSLSV